MPAKPPATPPAILRDAFVTINACRLHYLEGGVPDGPPLLMVHGLTREAHSFDPVFALLAARYRCLALDIRGRGQSDRSDPGQYSIVQYADDVLGFLDALGLGAVDYLGTSMGGLIAMTIADQAPQRFRRLALNDIGPDIAQAGTQRIQGHLASIPERFASYADAIAYETNRFPWLAQRPPAEVDAQYRHMIVRDADGTCRFHYDLNIRQGRAFEPEARRIQSERNWRGFRALACPLLLIRGDDTDLLAPETVAAMQQAQPTLAVAGVPGVGHAPALSEPEAQAALHAFFAG